MVHEVADDTIMLSPVRNHAGSAARFLRRADAESQVQLAQVEDLRVPITTTCTTTFVTERKQGVGVAHALVACHTHSQTGWGAPAWHSVCQACAVVCTHLAAIVSTSATAISSRLVMLQDPHGHGCNPEVLGGQHPTQGMPHQPPPPRRSESIIRICDDAD